ncbi:hypothetical protein GHT07_20645 [Caenimonas koreensis DSM 17982]|uniref:NYN domain-containing protein n=1 Tax=Caenimonas koreensis DSM 17982 TaxID=1121255 RepID=A0A844BDR6_9BURK|nr:hypothetical protein [Caenimonas koreensis]MRD49686.1 hypothetical protein [Caenimonas koreensis DSM 17982]
MKSASSPKSPRVRPCVIYVDTDNQRHQLARPLLATLRARGYTPRLAFLAGNNHAWALSQWHASFLQDPQLTRSTSAQPVPLQREAADAALMLAIGQRLREHLTAQETIVIVSGDLALLACAERVAAAGAACLVAHDALQAPPSLPLASVARLAVQAPEDSRRTPTTGRLLALLRTTAPLAAGGYLKAQVGTVLSRAGLGRQERAAFLASVPGLRERVVGGQRVLFF